MNIFYGIIFLLLKNFVKCDTIVNDPLFKNLPPIFQIDDYERCKKENKIYCKVSIILHPINITNTSVHWNLVEATIKHPKFYNHNELFHAICANNFCSNNIMKENSLDLETQITECYNVKYKHLGLKSIVTELNCQNSENHYTVGAMDITALIVALTYLLFIFFATYRDYQGNNKNNKCPSSENTIVSIFSLIANWKKLCSLNDRPDFQKLKFIQGIRFYNMLLIILCHTVCSYIGGYIGNTEYFELIYTSDVKRSIATLFVFLVQTFFLLSGFLLSYHVYQTMEKYKDSKKKYVFLTFLNRYLRIFPPLFVMIILASSNWAKTIFFGPIKDIYADKEVQRCQKNGWTNFLFINNHYHETEMCYFLSWYLAADTQLYLISLIILLIIWTYRHKTKTILALSVLVGILLPSLICYKYGLDMIYRLTPENTKNDNFRSFKFNAIYTSTFTNMASYMVGLCLGYWYFMLEKKNNWTKYYNSIGMLVFVTLPITVVYISSYEYSPIVTVILSGIVKPCYALGIGIGILGMSQQKNSVVKKVCEWKPALFLGNFTYSTYVVQFGIVFFRTADTKEPFYLSDYNLILSFLQDAVCSIFCGFLMHILLEMPALQLQKLYIPQVRNINSGKNSLKKN